MKIAVVGCGHVGLVTAVTFAEIGHDVVGLDSDEHRIDQLRRGESPFFEPGMAELLTKHLGDRLTFEDDMSAALDGVAAAFISVNTPPRPDGRANLNFVERATREIAEAARGRLVVVEKSTVPVRTARRILDVLRSEGRYPEIEVATNPEFLREGSAINDTLEPDRIVIGVAEDGRAEGVLREIYAPIVERTACPIIVTDLETAEIIKHASNSFLAMKVSYINAVAKLCERAGADVDTVAYGMGLDARIGHAHLSAGVGYGGTCFPKDLMAFVGQAADLGVDLSFLDHVRKINNDQRARLVEKVTEALWNVDGKTIAVWGLSFKAGTDDLREAPSRVVVPTLEQEGAIVRAYDPAAGPLAKSEFPRTHIASDAFAATDGADALVILTAWDEFRDVDLEALKASLRRPVVIDGRNLWSIDRMAELGFTYLSFGRPDVVDGTVRRVG